MMFRLKMHAQRTRQSSALLLTLLLSCRAQAIIGGVDVGAQDWLARSVVALQMNADGEIYHGSGFLVGPRIVLTAAHNVVQAQSIDVIFNPNPIYGLNHGSQSFAHVVRKVPHPSYGPIPLGTRDDVALIFLDREAPREFRPLPLARAGDRVRTPVLVAGFGHTVDHGTVDPEPFHLKETRLTQMLPASLGKLKFDQSKGTGLCGGDSGGPLLSRIGSTWKVVGIAIHASDERHENSPCLTKGIFTDVRAYRVWIDSVR